MKFFWLLGAMIIGVTLAAPIQTLEPNAVYERQVRLFSQQ